MGDVRRGVVVGQVRHLGPGYCHLVCEGGGDEFVVATYEQTAKGSVWAVRLKDEVEWDGRTLTVRSHDCGTRRVLKALGEVDVATGSIKRVEP